MKTIATSRFLRRNLVAAAATLLLTGPASLLAQDQTISGDLNVTGSLDISGSVLNLGTWTNDPAKLGLNITYAEDASHAASLSLVATRPITSWEWKRARSATNPTSVPQMTLNSGNALTLYTVDPTPQPAIVLDPVFGSNFNADVTFNGEYNKMPNQLADDPDCVLTVGLANNLYMARGVSGDSLALGISSSAAGTNSTALGAYSNATGPNSTALSYSASATKSYAVALGSDSLAAGVQSTALGAYSSATGDNSLTLGFSSLASKWGATTIGYGSQATGLVASAFGSYSVASGDYSVTLGYGSVADASLASALGSQSYAHGISSMALGFHSSTLRNLSLALGHFSTVDAEVAVGLGFGSSALGYGSTALGYYSVAKGDYSGSIGATEAGSVYEFVVGKHNVLGGNPHAWVSTDNIFTVGNGGDPDHRSNAFSVKKNGDTTVGGTLTVTNKMVANNLTVGGALLIQPQGDLAMGEFTAQPSPAP